MSAILTHVPAQRISPRARLRGVDAKELAERLVLAVKAASPRGWMSLKPEGVSDDTWKEYGKLRQLMPLKHFAHVLQQSAGAMDSVVSLLMATDERCRRRGPRRAKSGRRAIDVAVSR